MKIFISWSGPKSKAAAYLLRDWLPSVIQSLDTPWVSDIDIESGANWSATIGSELAGAKFGIVCVTRANQDRTWLNFEAGAISKLMGGAVPLLIDFQAAEDLSGGPMSQLQVRMTDVDGMGKLLADVNRKLEKPLDAGVLATSLSRALPEFLEKIQVIRDADHAEVQTAPDRDQDDKLNELLNLTRSMARIIPILTAASPDVPERLYPALTGRWLRNQERRRRLAEQTTLFDTPEAAENLHFADRVGSVLSAHDLGGMDDASMISALNRLVRERRLQIMADHDAAVLGAEGAVERTEQGYAAALDNIPEADWEPEAPPD